MKHALWKLSVFVLAGLAASAAQAQQAPEVVLRFNRWVPPTHHFHTRICVGWAEAVEKATNGRVKVEFTPASLGAPNRQFDLAETGVADVTASNQSYSPQRFPLARVAELPLLGDSAEAMSVAQWRVHEKYLAKGNEYKGTKLLGLFNNGPSDLFTTKKDVKGIADMRGMKIRSNAGIGTEVSAALGIVQVTGPITEAYEMLSRGIADGTLVSQDTVRSFQLDRVIEHRATIPGGFYNAAFFLVMNQAKWDSLSKQNQDAIMSVSGEPFARMAGRIWDEQDKMALDSFIKNGMKTHTLSGATLEEVRAKLAPVDETWIKEAEAKGVDGRAALKMLRDEIAKYKKP
jgi:TRAP-type C4-dicarboxylate transport system substrate-binding protein